jgi:3-dehydroquinate synthase
MSPAPAADFSVPEMRAHIRVELGARGYDIVIGAGTIGDIGCLKAIYPKLRRVLVVCDETIDRLHGPRLAAALEGEGLLCESIVLPPGEGTKSFAMLETLCETLLAKRIDRGDVIVAFGGGVIGDLAGFAAGILLRGIDYVQIPTTLLAQVDSSVGGKVGINLPGAKNMVGAFWQPRGVLIDTAALATLPEREYRAGLAEVVKYGVILDAEFFAYLEAHVPELSRVGTAHQSRDKLGRVGTAHQSRDKLVSSAQASHCDEVLRHVIRRSCELKAQVVAADEREETGQRAVLNYGHTFCHALETLTGYEQLLHGEAVAIGMLCASRLAERLGRIDSGVTRRQRDLLAALGLVVDLPDVDREEMLQLMSRDKKTEHGRLRFVLPSRLGHVELVGNVERADVLAAMG